jgi:hypothetical protein
MVLEPLVDHLREVVGKYAELEGAQRSVDNAFKLYVKTRPTASSESSRRARQLPREGAPPPAPAAWACRLGPLCLGALCPGLLPGAAAAVASLALCAAARV